MWRLILDGGMSLSEVKNMYKEDILEANAALDIYIEKINTSSPRGGR